MKTFNDDLETTIEAIERLSTGQTGMLEVGTTPADVKRFLQLISDITDIVEDGLGTRLTCAHREQVERLVDGWFRTASVG
jgi:phosphosulfolactate synthase (CoM biosynthesis protein A)